MGAPCKYNTGMCDTAVSSLAKGKSLAAVCAAIGICRDTLYEWRDTNPEFAKALKTGLQQAQAYWEQIGEDGITGAITHFSGSPWIFTMKNRFREDYKEEKTEPTLSESLVEKLIDKLIE